MYGKGQGVPANAVEAVKWYRLAADQGYAAAQFFLGVMYGKGQGVPQNAAEAVRWFRLGAEQGDPDTQFMLGVMYAMGEGVPQNNVKAYVWWSVSAAQGDEKAKGNRDIVAAELSPQDLSKAQAIATKCFESKYKNCD